MLEKILDSYPKKYQEIMQEAFKYAEEEIVCFGLENEKSKIYTKKIDKNYLFFTLLKVFSSTLLERTRLEKINNKNNIIVKIIKDKNKILIISSPNISLSKYVEEYY